MVQLGTVKVKTQDSKIVDLPVYELSDASYRVYDDVRIQTDSGVGFIPFIEVDDADYPEIRVKSNNYGVLAADTSTDLRPLEIDSFDDQNAGEYSFYENPDLGSGGLNLSYTTNTYTGNGYAVELSNGQGGAMWSYEGDGLNYYQDVGDVIRTYFKLKDSGTSSDFFFLAADNDNDGIMEQGYSVQLSKAGTDDPSIREWKGETFDETYESNVNGNRLATTNNELETDRWYRIEISIDSTTTVKIYDTAAETLFTELTADITNYGFDGVGFSQDDGPIVFDNVEKIGEV